MRSIPDDPYAFARVSVMKGALLRKDDYDKLLKMQRSEIVKFLQDNGFRQDFDAVESAPGFLQVELAVAKNLERAHSKLLRISNPQLAALIELYLGRNDVENITLLARHVAAKRGEEPIAFFPPGKIPISKLRPLLKKDSLADLVKTLGSLLGEQKIPTTQIELEEWLARRYYSGAITAAKDIPHGGEIVKVFILKEALAIDIQSVVRMRAAGLDDEAIKKKLIAPHEHLIASLFAIKDMEKIFDALAKTEFKNAAREGKKAWEEKKSLIRFETAMRRDLLRSVMKMQHAFPGPLDLILGFLFTKAVEARNIRLIAKGKDLDLPVEQIEAELVL